MTENKFYKLNQLLTTRTDLTSTDKIVYSVIIDKIGNNDYSWIGTRKLANDCGCSRWTILRSIKNLDNAGLLIVKHRKNGQTNHYSLPESGGKNTPVAKIHRCEFATRTGGKNTPVAVANSHHNQTDPYNQTHIRAVDEENANGSFKIFWKAYPRKVSKAQAQKAWGKVGPDDELFKKIMSALENQKRSDQWQKSSGQFIPHPATWLNQRRWEDQVDLPDNDMGFCETKPLDEFSEERQRQVCEVLGYDFNKCFN